MHAVSFYWDSLKCTLFLLWCVFLYHKCTAEAGNCVYKISDFRIILRWEYDMSHKNFSSWISWKFYNSKFRNIRHTNRKYKSIQLNKLTAHHKSFQCIHKKGIDIIISLENLFYSHRRTQHHTTWFNSTHLGWLQVTKYYYHTVMHLLQRHKVNQATNNCPRLLVSCSGVIVNRCRLIKSK